jgi:hypothetical protein
MNEMTASPTAGQPQRRNVLVLVAFLAGLILLGLLAFRVFSHRQVGPSPAGTSPIQQAAFEQQYGLRVNLVAVTAAGGMVDLRLKIVDAEKAQALLGNRTNYPALLVGDDLVLHASQETINQEIKYENGGSVYALFPNAGNIVKPGTPVTILFGDRQLEPIPAR